MDGHFSTHQIADINDELRTASVNYRQDVRHVSILVMDYESGTAIRGGAIALVNRLYKKCKTAELILGSGRPIKLPVGSMAV